MTDRRVSPSKKDRRKATEYDLEHAWALVNDPKIYDPRYTNDLTLAAKDKLLKSSYKVCREIADVIATGENNNKQLDNFIKRQDRLRKIDIKDYLNF